MAARQGTVSVERPPAERAAFLASAAGDDEALRREVESLLASDAADVSFLDGVAVAAIHLPSSRAQIMMHAGRRTPRIHGDGWLTEVRAVKPACR